MIQFKMAIALTALAASITCALSAKSDPAPATQPDLVAENARLLARTRELENRVKQLEQLLSIINAERTHPERDPLKSPDFRLDGPLNLPPGTRRHEFNGDTFFVIPLSNRSA